MPFARYAAATNNFPVAATSVVTGSDYIIKNLSQVTLRVTCSLDATSGASADYEFVKTIEPGTGFAHRPLEAGDLTVVGVPVHTAIRASDNFEATDDVGAPINTGAQTNYLVLQAIT